MTQSILITRPEEDVGPLQNQLEEMGFETVSNPILSISYHDDVVSDLDNVQAILFTSANGVRAFIRQNSVRSLPVFTVGHASARAAREAGFTSVESADGDVEALANLVKKDLDPKNGALLHIAASRVAGDLAGALGQSGFEVRRDILYTAQVAEKLLDQTQEAFHQNKIDAVLLFSPRTAIAFVSLMRAADLEEACSCVTVFCLSPAVAKVVGMVNWQGIEIAQKPNQEALLDAVTEWSQR